MTSQQRKCIAELEKEGFRIEMDGVRIRMARGNDYRMIWPDGSIRRAVGARR